MQSRGIHHVGVAVTDLDEAVETYARLFGGTLEHRDVVPDQGVEAASVLLGGEPDRAPRAHARPTPRSGAFSRSAARASTTSRTRSTISAPPSSISRPAGAELIDVVPRVGLFGLQVAFIHPDAVHGVLTEVVSLD